MNRLKNAFAFSGSPDRAANVVEVVRVAFGLSLAHQFLDMNGFAVLGPDAAHRGWNTLLGAALGLLIAAGWATTPALLAWLALVHFAAPVGYLGMQVARLLAWGLLLLGAGRRFSIDARLRRQWGAARAFTALDSIGSATSASFAETRLLLVALYWAVTLSGVRAHLADPFWHRGDVLQLVLVTPYLTDHYEYFASLRDSWPAAYDGLLTLGLALQVLWQAFLLPLFLAPWRFVRAFAVLQGLGFFVISLLVLNLGYLGAFEICLWVLLFGHRPFFGLPGAGERGGGLVMEPAPMTWPRRTVLLAGSFAFALFFVQTIVGMASPRMGAALRELLSLSGLWDVPLGPFGQRRVNVFNREDLMMGADLMVIVETDEGGHPFRVVPFADWTGGRLDYLRNDHLYFNWSLPWQRLPESMRARAGPGSATRALASAVVDLDHCLTDRPAPRFYRVFLRRHLLLDEPRFPVWSAPRDVGSFEVRVGRGRAREIAARLEGGFLPGGCFSLPPGQAWSARREAATLLWARTQALPSP